MKDKWNHEWKPYLCCDGHAPRHKLPGGLVARGHHAELAGGDKLVEGANLVLRQGGHVLISVRVGVRGLTTRVCVRKGRHGGRGILLLSSFFRRLM